MLESSIPLFAYTISLNKKQNIHQSTKMLLVWEETGKQEVMDTA